MTGRRFSSATSMVIVAALALSTMVSNHIVMPIWLSFTGGGASVSGDVRHVVLLSRRISIGAVVALDRGDGADDALGQRFFHGRADGGQGLDDAPDDGRTQDPVEPIEIKRDGQRPLHHGQQQEEIGQTKP